MTDWRPIETAPRRKPVLLGWWHDVGGTELMWRQGPGEVVFSLIHMRPTGRLFGFGYATHWDDLPEPPK